MPQQAAAHHGRQGQRNHRRCHHGDGQRECELAEHAADQTGHEQERYKDRNQRDRERNHGEANFACAAQRGRERVLAIFHVAHDVLDHDDGIIDHEAGADRQRHERQIIERKAAEPHDAEGRDNRQGQRDAGDDGGAHGAQENEHDGNDQRHAQDKRELHVADRRADTGGCVVHDRERRTDRYRALQFRQLVFDALHRLDDIGAGLTLDIDHDSRHTLVKAADPAVLESVDDVGHITEQDRSSVAVGHNDIAVGISRGELVVGSDGVGLVRAVERAFGAGDVRRDDHIAQILERDTVIGETREVGLDADSRADIALHGDASHTGNFA